ncbi:Hsp20/alpha crystallin family protein [bacterium]|nr:Hsp20/alpha crystallin family protein [bacterium]
MSFEDSDSLNELSLIQRQVMELLKNMMFSESLGIWTETQGVFTPTVDLFETDEELICLVELPGVKKENIKVLIEENTLYIIGNKKMTEKADAEYICIERVFGQFSRRIIIPKPFNRFKSKTVLSNGLLKIFLPKISSDRRSEGYVLEIHED